MNENKFTNKPSNNRKLKEFIAHIKQNSCGHWEKPHLLKDHLTVTAQLASIFASEFKNDD